jgi:hypothetical protein
MRLEIQKCLVEFGLTAGESRVLLMWKDWFVDMAALHEDRPGRANAIDQRSAYASRRLTSIRRVLMMIATIPSYSEGTRV